LVSFKKEIESMKRVLASILSIWMIGYAALGFAEGDGTGLMKQCTEAVKAMDGVEDPDSIDFGDAGRCMGVVDGFAGAAAYYETKPGSPNMICFPAEGATVGQSVRIVNKYLHNNPQQLHEPSTVLIFGAFVTAFPCP
jgi:hypothetical protein